MNTVTVSFPTSPAMSRALANIQRVFANRHGRALSMSRTMLHIGAHHCATRARYGQIARRVDEMQINLNETIQHLRFAYLCERRPYERQVLMEAIMLCRWIRRHDRNAFYWIRDALSFDPSVYVQAAE